MQNDETIVAVFDTAEHAAAAVRDLEAAGIPHADITQHAGDITSDTTNISAQTASAPRQEPGFWASLFGAEPEYGHDTAVYDRSLQSGSTLVTVRGTGSHLDQVLDILERHSPIDIDERAVSYGVTGTATGTTQTGTTQTGTTANTYAGGTAATATTLATARIGAAAAGEPGTIQLSEETLSVGKRAINRGTTRVRRYVVETPVEQQVSLHDERVTVERRPVTDGRAVAGDSFADRTIELTETAEEAVISKQARVTEEIVLRKEAADRTETVRDTVRREDVEITKEPGTQTAGATGIAGTTLPHKPAV